jgi:hypothetical protein
MTQVVSCDMDKHLYPNFLTDPDEYAKAEALWTERWEEIRRSAMDPDAWEAPWFGTTFADGTPCRDGNPIFSAFSPLSRRGIRVIQQEPSADPHEPCVWIDTFDKDGSQEIDELVISCALTRKTLIDAMDMMSQWMDEGELSQERFYPHSPTRSGRRHRGLSQLVPC